MGIGHGFLGSKCFGSNQEKGLLRVHFFQALRNMCAIHIRYKVHFHAFYPIGAQGFSNHDRTKITSTNADVYNLANGLSGVSLPNALVYLGADFLHLFQYTLDVWHDIDTFLHDRFSGKISQGGMQYCAVLSFIDFLSNKHSLNGFR